MLDWFRESTREAQKNLMSQDTRKYSENEGIMIKGHRNLQRDSDKSRSSELQNK
jgi:hypothetical protein